jgi:hypothetical protein
VVQRHGERHQEGGLRARRERLAGRPDPGRRRTAGPGGGGPDRPQGGRDRRGAERRHRARAGVPPRQEAGIKVLTHESPDQKFNDWNIELTTVQGFGESHLEALANAMGGEGKYIVYVGSLTVPLHNKWADAAIALQKSKYPKMQWLRTASAWPRASTTATRPGSTRCAPTRT